MKAPKFPLHSLVVHVPVGAWTAALVFDLLSRAQVGGNAMVRLAFYSIALGLATTLLAIPTGIVDWSQIKKEKPAWRIGLFHMAANFVVAIIFAADLGVRLSTWQTAEISAPLHLLLSAVGTACLFGGAYLGGLMVYDHGIGVARASKKKWRRIAEAGHARVPEEQGS